MDNTILRRFFLILLGLIALTAFSTKVTFAHEIQDIPNIVAQDQPLRYNLKRVGEKIQMTWTQVFNTGKVGELTAKLTKERERELVHIVQSEKAMVYLETAASRYITYTGFLAEQVENDKVKKELVKESFEETAHILSHLRDGYPAQTAQWLMLQQAIDSTDVLVSKASESSQ